MFSEEKLWAKKMKRKKTQQQESNDIKSFNSNTSYGLEYEKTASLNYLLRCSLKKSKQ